MVCNRCKMVVKAELIQLGLNPVDVQLGVVTINGALNQEMLETINTHLLPYGFSLLEDKKQLLAEQVKAAIINLAHYGDGPLKVNLSTHLTTALNHDYASLSTTFSGVTQQTIEQYFIAQKIEKVKELLAYQEESLSTIAYMLNYSSVAHLSNQFKKITGKTPSAYKKELSRERRALDEL